MAILLYYALTVEWLCYILFASSIRRILIRIKDFALGTAIYPSTNLSLHWRYTDILQIALKSTTLLRIKLESALFDSARLNKNIVRISIFYVPRHSQSKLRSTLGLTKRLCISGQFYFANRYIRHNLLTLFVDWIN